jgi:hypothetical protein
VAEDGQPVVEGTHPAFARLIEATDRMRGMADGLSELRRYPSAPAV